MRLGYLYSRYPVLSQTFCDTEMLELERRGFSLFIGAIHPPLTSIRHEHAARLKAVVHYAPPASILKLWEKRAKDDYRWPDKLIAEHERRYGAAFKPALRASNACYFAYLFAREGVQHFHVHFANRAAHTALFLKQIMGIPFSITAHGQDFMSDLGNEDLLREICDAAEFVAVETDYSRGLLSARCPGAVTKIHRVYNGMDFSNFHGAAPPPSAIKPVRILSVGRLVEFKGFEHLIEACGVINRRGCKFSCEIVGDGPLRDRLQTKISTEHLDDVVTLAGALPQQAVFDKLRSCDIFGLASTIDHVGASDVFPTVILEAMASARPVVSTAIAGIPEAVVHGLTGLVVPSGDAEAFANALERLISDPWLRVTFGIEGRARIERYFQVETTIAPLIALFQRIGEGLPPETAQTHKPDNLRTIAYLIERWPDPQLPFLDAEIMDLRKRNVAVTAFVCEPAEGMRLNKHHEAFARTLTFLPDALVSEAEWQAHGTARHQLEEERASDTHRAPSAIFLRQARHAIALQRLVQGRNISHVHATNSRVLLTALMLKNLIGVTVSATIERQPELPAAVLQAALSKCKGGRIMNEKLRDKTRSADFLQERPAWHGVFAQGMRSLGDSLGVDVGGRRSLWQRWFELLVHWEVK